MRTKRFQAGILLLTAPLIVGGCAGKMAAVPERGSDLPASEYLKQDDAFDGLLKASGELSEVAAVDGMKLFVGGKSAEVVFQDKNGLKWYTNPPQRVSDTIAQGGYADSLNAQVLIEYNDESDKGYVVNSHADSVSLGQYEFYPLENGVRVNYVLGKAKKVYVVPMVMSEERYQEIISKLDEADQVMLSAYYQKVSLDDVTTDADRAVYLQKYPGLKKRDLYAFTFNSAVDSEIPDFLLEQLEQYFKKAGYTKQQLDADNKVNLVAENKENDYSIAMSLEYRMSSSGLAVEVPYNSLKYDEKIVRITKMSVLPFFGAAGADDEGYMVVPDGSGAVITLNNGKTELEPYIKRVYGPDRTILQEVKDSDALSQIYFPVYGIKTRDKSFVAVIEEGDAIASITAQISGKYDSYNAIYPSFCYSEKEIQTNSVLNLSGNTVYQKEKAKVSVKLRFLFQYGETADYSGMAAAYRQYLLDQGKLAKAEDDKKQMHINFIGSVKYDETILGIPVKADKTLTSYSQAKEILDALQEMGAVNISFGYSGWANDGYENTVYNKVKLPSSLGGEKGFSDLVSYAKQSTCSFYPQANFLYTYQDRMFDGFQGNKNAARTISDVTAKDYDYRASTLTLNKDKPRFITSPFYFGTMIEGFLNTYQGLGNPAVSVSNMGSDLNSDFNKSKMADRESAKEFVRQTLDTIQKQNMKIMADGANAYTLQYASCVNRIPLGSGQNYLFDYDIPFMQLVLSGALPYYSEPLNYSSDLRKEQLRLLETGTMPSFEWIYADNSELFKTDYNFYSVNYKSWLKDAVSIYQETEKVLKGSIGKQITKSERVQANVYHTVYETGLEVYVNYNEAAVTVDGMKIEPFGYSAKGGNNE